MKQLRRHQHSSTPTRPRLAGLVPLLAVLAAACGGGEAPDGGAATGSAGASPGAEAPPAEVTPAMIAGDPDGPVVIEEYADYQCPFCARHYLESHEGIDSLLRQGGIRFEVYEVAGPAHFQALDATVAARCAGEQGAYAEARHAIYTSQQEWSGSVVSDTLLRSLVRPLVADPEALDDCLEGQRVTVGRILNQNLRQALAEGTRSTPTTVVRMGNATQVLAGVVPAEAIAAAVASVREAGGAREGAGATGNAGSPDAAADTGAGGADAGAGS